MNLVKQEPSIIDIKIGSKDDLNFVITFENLDLSLYTFEARIELKTGGFRKINVNPYDLVHGQIEIEITKEVMASLPNNISKTWSLSWTRLGKTREIFTGKFE